MSEIKKAGKAEESVGDKTHPQKTPKQMTPFHNAMFGTFSETLDEAIQNGKVELQDEHRLSADALRIDMMILKKEPDFMINRVWGKFMRGYNILEYKSPSAPAPSIRVFNKVIHGYAGIYSAQRRVRLTDMTATIICTKKPLKLFKTLEEYYNYKILRGAPGIYYIRLKGVPIEKTLAIQIMVCSELPDSEFMLKALVPGIDEDMAKKVLEVLNSDVDNRLSYWVEAVLEKNLNIIIKVGESMKNSKNVEKVLMEYGYCDKWRQEGKQEGRQEGWQEGRQEGLEEGWQEGLEEEKRRTARAMMADKMDVNTIARITGLTVDEIRRL
jgi:hypothetical protein